MGYAVFYHIFNHYEGSGDHADQTGGKRMVSKFKRFITAFLLAVLLVGPLSATHTEAALASPARCRFLQWNNTSFSSATIAWDGVWGADYYQVRCTWTDGKHDAGGFVNGSYNGVVLSNLNYKHVYEVKVRALNVNSSGAITAYSPWSNIISITPLPKNVSAKLSSSGKVKLKWNKISGSNGYNVFLTTNPYGAWKWNCSTKTKSSATSASVSKFNGKKFKKYQNYYVRIVTRRKQNGVFRPVPAPTASYYQYKFFIYNKKK